MFITCGFIKASFHKLLQAITSYCLCSNLVAQNLALHSNILGKENSLNFRGRKTVSCFYELTSNYSEEFLQQNHTVLPMP